MYTPKYPRYRRKSGAFTALWLTVLVLSVGLFGAGAGGQESDQAPTAGFSGALDAAAGVPSSTALNALPNWVRQSAESGEGDDDSFAAVAASLSEDERLSLAVADYSAPAIPGARHPLNHSPRAPPV